MAETLPIAKRQFYCFKDPREVLKWIRFRIIVTLDGMIPYQNNELGLFKFKKLLLTRNELH
uniref:Uncharacterized protein n=1 Tax=Lepeophtheirus salmonis TaxID=72036 RepID=A0A0K2VGD4_LEPSM